MCGVVLSYLFSSGLSPIFSFKMPANVAIDIDAFICSFFVTENCLSKLFCPIQ